MTTLSDRLKQSRKNAGLTQSALAKAVGITQPTYQALETGKVTKSSYLLQIAEVLKVNSHWLATGHGDMLGQVTHQNQKSHINYEPSTSTIELMEILKEMEKDGELTPQVVGLLHNTLKTLKSVSGQKLSVAHLVESPSE